MTLAIACGRVTVPYLRALKRGGGARVFAVFLQDPALRARVMDLIWVSRTRSPRAAQRHHDADVAASVLAGARWRLRAAPDARLAALPNAALRRRARRPERRAALHRRRPDAHDARRSRAIVAPGLLRSWRRRRAARRRSCSRRCATGSATRRASSGTATGDNPYASILALADAVLVTGDSANMVGEATATGAPVHVFEPSGGDAGKLGQAIDALERLGAVQAIRRADRALRLCADRFEQRHRRRDRPSLRSRPRRGGVNRDGRRGDGS